MSKTIGFFGGSFDPFHLGHLNFVIEILEKSHLDEIWICPTTLSPFKADIPPLDVHHRIEMIKLAIAPIANLKVINTEAQDQGVCYTYNTLMKLKAQFGPLTLLLSDDLLASFDKWYKVDEIIKNFPLLVGKREHYPIDKKLIAPLVFKEIEKNIIPIRLIDVCSSELRVRLKNKLYCNHLLPLKILDYIDKNKLYS